MEVVKGIRLRARGGYYVLVGTREFVVSKGIFHYLKKLLRECGDVNLECLEKALGSAERRRKRERIARCFGRGAR